MKLNLFSAINGNVKYDYATCKKNNSIFRVISFKGDEISKDVFIASEQTQKTAREKQLSGEFYYSGDPELVDLQNKSRDLMQQFNSTYDYHTRQDIMHKWFKSVGERCFIAGKFFCDFGCNLTLGNKVFINDNCTILDSGEVNIGDHTLIGPGVKLCTADHSIIPEERLRKENVCGKPINIGKNCWICAGVTILPGVTIGDGTVIGAGSVVTKDIPSRCVAFGIPCNVFKTIP